MASFNGKGKQVHMMIPDWVRAEKNENIRAVLIGKLFAWEMFGYDAVNGESANNYFSADFDGWTQKDTDYVIDQFVKHGYIKLDNQKRCLSLA